MRSFGFEKGTLYTTIDMMSAAYQNQQEYQLAIADYDRAIELDPSDAWVYFIQGLAHLRLGNVPLARVDYTRSYELAPTDANAAWMAEWARIV